MGIFNNWIIRQGARGLTTTLLTLYRKAVLSGVVGERERWLQVLNNPNSGLFIGNKVALSQVLGDDHFWDNPEQSMPASIVIHIVMRKAMNDVGMSFIHPDFVQIIGEGVARGIEIIKRRYPDIKI